MNEELARSIAEKAHAGQFRRDGKTPYLTHVERVVDRLKADKADRDTICAAWLHDVLEDSSITYEDLQKLGITESVAWSVWLLTKDEGADYISYLSFIKENTVAKRVKIADMLDNISDRPTPKQILKYARGLQYLLT